MQAINMDAVYSEVMYLYKQGMRYWFVDEEIDELHRLSTAFHVQTAEYELLMQYFVKPTEEEEADYFMTTTHVLSYLRNYSSVNLSKKRMGEAIQKAGFKRLIKRINDNPSPVYGYRIKKVLPVPMLHADYG